MKQCLQVLSKAKISEPHCLLQCASNFIVILYIKIWLFRECKEEGYVTMIKQLVLSVMLALGPISSQYREHKSYYHFIPGSSHKSLSGQQVPQNVKLKTTTSVTDVEKSFTNYFILMIAPHSSLCKSSIQVSGFPQTSLKKIQWFFYDISRQKSQISMIILNITKRKNTWPNATHGLLT